MSRDWTPQELQAASEAMKAAGHMSFEEFCADIERQDSQRLEPQNREWLISYASGLLKIHRRTMPEYRATDAVATALREINADFGIRICPTESELLGLAAEAAERSRQ